MTEPRTSPTAPANTPEATGGVGTVLEFEFSALALAALILHEPLMGLGAPWIPSAVAAQQEASSPVDDIVVTADARGDRMTYYVASRRSPVIGPSSGDTVKMFADFLGLLRERVGSFTDGSALIGLAVAGPHTAVTEVDRLAAIAAEQHDPTAFRAAVAVRSGQLRTRLRLVDEILDKAANRLAWPDAVRREQDWSWFLLRSLRVAQPRLERDGPDLAYVVGRLGGLVGTDDAMTCWQRLCKIAQTVAGTAGAVDEATVRRQLRGHVRVASAPALADARAVLDAREADLRARTRGLLVGPSGGQWRELTLERRDARQALAERLATVGAAGGALVVRGEPNVGKSTLVLHAVDDVRTAGGAVTALSLRDLRGQLTALEGQLRIPLWRVLAGSAVAPERLLVLDGSEAVQEGAADVFTAVVSAGVDAGLGVVTVCRDDAAAAVSARLAEAAAREPHEFVVKSLEDDDVDAVLSGFDALARLRDRRSRWLLGRVGLAAMLLRGGMELQAGPLAEADVFDACWRGWVRRREQAAPGEPTPDERERAMLAIARRELGTHAPDESPGALLSLRSDGLLLPFGAGASWRPADAFSDDVVRDLATSRLLLTTGVRTLAAASAPRWAIHAALVACQGQMLRAADELVPAVAAIVTDCAAVAESFGERWSDLPWEALLTSPLVSRLLDDPDADPTGERRSWLVELLRVARQRFVNATIGDPLALEPLVDWLARQVPVGGQLPREVREPADELTLAWLRGLAMGADDTVDEDVRAVRWQVRDALRSRAADDRVDPTVLLGTALLSHDLEQQDHDLLVGVAADRPGFLADVVEDVAVARTLAGSNPDLLADLTLGYYRADRRDRYAGWADDGVRRHTHVWGFGVLTSAWYFGPFWALLQADPALGLATINALLDHAVADGSARPARSWDLLGTGPRDFFGDMSTYTWYRGMGVCPAPCTSALLAVERLADASVRAGVPVRDVASHLLTSTTALPMVALVVGFVVRHFDAVTDELDDILATPELWDLEITRATHEHTGMLLQHDEPEVAGCDRRRWSLRDAAMALVANAKLTGDDVALQRLTRVRERLLAEAAAGADGRAPVSVRMNAGFLVADSYGLQPLADGTVAVQYNEPADVTAELAEERTRLARVQTVLGLSNRYRLRLIPPHGNEPPDIDADRLVADLAAVRSLGDAPLDDREYDAGVAVAAAVVRAAARGVNLAAAGMPLDGILWARSAVLIAAKHQTQHPLAIEESLYSSGADRVAASAVPSLLRRGFADAITACGANAPMDANDVQYIVKALTALATSRFHEVRRFVALALREVWAEPCHDLLGTCPHWRAWTAVEEAAADVAFAPWHDGRRDYTRLKAPVVEALLSADEKDLALPRLSAALAMVTRASASAACLADDAVPLRDALLDAWARTSVHYSHEGYSTRPEEHVLVADALLATTDADPELLPRAIGLLGGLTEATSDLLDACCTAAAYSAERRDQLGCAWPTLMAGVLDHPVPAEPDTPRRRGFRGRSNAVAALIPRPQPVTFDEDMDATIRAAAEGWPRVADLTDLIDRWLPLGAGSGRAIDNLVRLLRTAPLDEQIDRGLPWIRSLVARPGRTVTDSFTVVGWLESIRGSGRLAAGSRHHYDVLVDALATAGSLAAQQLQAQDE